MPEAVKRKVRVECQDCSFAAEIDESDDVLPAEVVIEHGRETGHKLRVEHSET